MRRVLLLCIALFALTADVSQAASFPKGFLWGVANAGFQSEMGQGRNVDRNSDWWVWAHDRREHRRRARDRRPARAQQRQLRAASGRDIDLAAGLGLGAYRFDIEWSRIFPRSTASAKLSAAPSRSRTCASSTGSPTPPRSRTTAPSSPTSTRRGLVPFVTAEPLHAPDLDPRPDRHPRRPRRARRQRPAAGARAAAAGSTPRPSTSSASTPPTSRGSSATWSTLDPDQRAARGRHQRLRQRAGRLRRLLPARRVHLPPRCAHGVRT